MMVSIEDLGLISYNDAFDKQKQEKQRVLEGLSEGSIYLLEHNPVITVGLNADGSSILYGESIIKANGYEIFKTTRGGDVTVHEPGQLVVYFILPLKKTGVKKFVQIVMDTVQEGLEEAYQLKTVYDKEKPGLYVEGKKICSVGFDLRGGVSMHGVAINVVNDLKGFKLVNPCGYTGLEMTSVQKELKKNIDMEILKSVLHRRFKELF